MEDVATLTIADAGCDEWNDGNQCYGTITFYIYKGTGYTGEQGSEACTLDSGQTPVYSGTAQKVDGTTTTFTSTSQTLPAGLLLVRRVLGDESQ